MTSHDDIIPLSKPIVGVSGKVYNQLAVSRGTLVVISPFGYNLWATFGIYHPSILAHRYDATGAQRCGALTLMNGVPNDGSMELGTPKRRLERTGTCVLCLFELWSTADALVELPSPGVSGLVLDGDLRPCFLLYS